MVFVSSVERASGEPGVGKTAVAEGLAHRMAANQVPQNLKGTLYSLDLGALFAGAGKGEYEEVRDTLKCSFIFLN
jgi:ATP-dependent Clp protease ATP-binding subunit ClpA